MRFVTAITMATCRVEWYDKLLPLPCRIPLCSTKESVTGRSLRRMRLPIRGLGQPGAVVNAEILVGLVPELVALAQQFRDFLGCTESRLHAASQHFPPPRLSPTAPHLASHDTQRGLDRGSERRDIYSYPVGFPALIITPATAVKPPSASGVAA